MSDQLTRRVVAHRNYLDDMLRSLGYAMTDLGYVMTDIDAAPALPVACADCRRSRDCAAWLDARVADFAVRRSGAANPADDPQQVWPRFCPNREAVQQRLRAAH